MKQIINVVDAPCGYGKTSWAIQAMNEASTTSHHFIYVTPFLNEVERVKETVSNRMFHEPLATGSGTTKLESLHQLLREKKDICTTHALFQSANAETRRLLKDSGYTLILDEVLNVIEQVDLKRNDLQLLLKSGAISIEANNLGIKYIQWNDEFKDSQTKYDKEKNMALTGNLLYCSDSVLIWNLPCDMFKLFDHVYLLTYLFSGQLQRYYYDLHNIQYRYLSVTKEEQGYQLVPYDQRTPQDKVQLRELVDVYQGNLNDIGSKINALSSTWLKKPENQTPLKKNAYNFLTNKVKATTSNSLWTTILHSKKNVAPRNFAKAFIPVNARATNEYKDRFNLAYLANRYMLVMEKKFFEQYGVNVDQDIWALSELIQWVWRSRIRDGKPINLYLPSSRMRTLLKLYLTSDVFETPPVGAITNQHPSDWNFA
ncbi:DEAD/DEAH box helicase family protein [Fictibacillus halophilus]|uniref:DEAD/DEAH box helicase family protein n=1 Tax=Fictibacillus halophilus TaxID=1610490 RepID=UPI00363EC1F2